MPRVINSSAFEFIQSCLDVGKRSLSHLNEHLEHLKKQCELVDKQLEFMSYTWAHQLATICSDEYLQDPDWLLLGGRILMAYLHSVLPGTFSGATKQMQRILKPEYAQFVFENAVRLDEMICSDYDYEYGFSSMMTLMNMYLARDMEYTKSEEGIVEAPQYMNLRIATFMWYAADLPDDEKWDNIARAYQLLSTKQYMHATPTIFNAGMKEHTLTSCFTTETQDTTESIAKGLYEDCHFSKGCGGVGKSLSAIRHSLVRGRKQKQDLLYWMRPNQEIMRAFDQGAKRKGSLAVFVNIWHIDVEKVIDMRVSEVESERLRDLYHGLWIPDEFMRRVHENKPWTLFCPNQVKGLDRMWGTQFEEAYRRYEEAFDNGLITFAKRIDARRLLKHIINVQFETGMPYMLYGDAVNRKNNQMNIGPIVTSNLCTEILLHTDENNIGSCNLSSIILSAYLDTDPDTNVITFNYERLHSVVEYVVTIMDRVIDMNFYYSTIPRVKESNDRNRPIGIGVQGLANVFAALDLSWDSEEAKQVNHDIFETIYHAAVTSSVALAKRLGPYPMFDHSPASQGFFQFDLWTLERDHRSVYNRYIPGKNDINFNIDPSTLSTPSDRYDWNALRQSMMSHGLRHSQLVALMPTASTSLISGVCEAFEPFKQTIYARTIGPNQYPCLVEPCVRELMDLGIWNEKTRNQIIQDAGSISNITVPDASLEDRLCHIKQKYMSCYEIPNSVLVRLTVDRAKFVCQSQSFNCFMNEPSRSKMLQYHYKTWKAGLKTGMYYLRTTAAQAPINFTRQPLNEPTSPSKPTIVCTDDICVSCQ